MTPDKCPKCGAEAYHSDETSTDYECGSSIYANDPSALRTTLDEFDPCEVRALKNQRDQLAARVKELEELRTQVAARNLSNMLYVEGLRKRVKRLEEAGDRLAAMADQEWLSEADIETIIDDWHTAKEARP